MKKKIKEPEKRKPATLDMVTALVGEHQWLNLVADRYPKSTAIVELLHELGADPDYHRPSVKEITAKTGLPGPAVTKAIHQLYEAIWELNEQQQELFKGPGHPYTLCFYDRHYGDIAHFTLWLEQPVREGDSFEWYFIRPKQDTYSYYADSVNHEYQGGRQTVSVSLKSGQYSIYRKLLFEKARLLGLLSFDELYSLKDYQVDELLVHRVEKDKAGYPESLAYLNKKRY